MKTGTKKSRQAKHQSNANTEENMKTTMKKLWTQATHKGRVKTYAITKKNMSVYIMLGVAVAQG